MYTYIYIYIYAAKKMEFPSTRASSSRKSVNRTTPRVKGVGYDSNRQDMSAPDRISQQPTG